MASILAEVQFQEGGRFFQTTLSDEEYMHMLKSGGVLDGKPITAIKLFDFPNNENKGLIFDFVLARKGTMPWRTLEINL